MVVHELVYDAGTKKQFVGAKHPHECVDGHALLNGGCGGTCVDEFMYNGGSTRLPFFLLAPTEVDYLHRVYGAVVSRGWVRWVSNYLWHVMLSTLLPVEHTGLRQLGDMAGLLDIFPNKTTINPNLVY